ncbi:hypothetical protein GCM10008908_02520 [Clostridium subterminale]|uniref:Uncharacterized protein n=1 Tax=Clostridium subterminale TaxID=1550 RepID=A0ABP3VTY4_CLOSU
MQNIKVREILVHCVIRGLAISPLIFISISTYISNIALYK